MSNFTDLESVISGAIHNKRKQALLENDNSDIGNIDKEDRKSLMTLYQASGIAKVRYVCDYITDLLNANQKFLVFAHHLDVLNEIENKVKNMKELQSKKDKKKQCYFRLDGSTPAKKRQELIQTFQTDNDIRVGLLAITAGLL